jgi:hypothetical protein
LVVTGGLGVGGVVQVGGNIVAASSAVSTSTTTGALVIPTGGVGIGGAIYNGGVHVSTGNIVAASSAVSTSTTTGALVVTGGLGVGGNLYVGGNIVQQTGLYQLAGNITNTGGNLTCNFNNGSIFNVFPLTANVTANLYNVYFGSGISTTATIIINQGATPYTVSNILINGGTVRSITWKGTTTPAGVASKKDVITLQLLFLPAGAVIALGQLTTFG